MIEFYRDEEKSAIDSANEERARNFVKFSGMLLRAPRKLIQLGYEDFRRYRRPQNYI
jgi:hypothetical protein